MSSVFRTIDPPPPLHPASISSPHTIGREVHTRRAVRGWGVNISEDARHWIGLLQYNPSTLETVFYRANKKEDAVKHLAVPRQYSVLSRPPQAEITRQNVSISTAAILFFLTGIYSETEQTDRHVNR